jgi:D-aspartate ligase
MPVQKKKLNQAWVLGLFDTGVQAARSLASQGIPVVGVDCDPRMPGFHSRFIRAELAGSPLDRPEILLEWLVERGSELTAPGVLLPATDAYALFVSRHRESLSPYFHFALPAPGVVEALFDKALHVRLAQSVGEVCPPTFELEDWSEAEALSERLRYPVFIKARFAHHWRMHFSNKGFVAEDKQMFLTHIRHIQERDEKVVVQEIITGPPENHFEVNFYRSVRGDGEILALLGVRKLRQYPRGFGVGTLVETFHQPEVIRRALSFARAIDFRGIGNIEYKKDERTGKYYLVELNPRLWQQNSQAAACGIDFPVICYNDLLGLETPRRLEFPDGVKWLDPLADFQAFVDLRKSGELGMAGWMRSWQGVRAQSLFAWNDVMPFMVDIEYGLKLLKLPLYLMRNSHSRKKGRSDV